MNIRGLTEILLIAGLLGSHLYATFLLIQLFLHGSIVVQEFNRLIISTEVPIGVGLAVAATILIALKSERLFARKALKGARA